MKRLLIVLLLMINIVSLNQTSAQKQPQSDFEVLKGKNDSDVVYRGTVTFEDIRRVPAFRFEEAVKDYSPKEKAMQALDGLKDYQLVVFLGTWCEDSHRMIPQLYKVLQAAHYPMESLSLNALDRDKQGKDDIASRYKITLVPTVVVLKDGKEMGRITEIPDKTVEQDLLKIISQH